MDDLKRPPGRPKVLTDRERRKRILDVAGELFMEEGFEATDMKRIAERAGMSKRTLYLVFQNKEELFATLVCDPDAATHDPSSDAVEASGEAGLIEVLVRLAVWVLTPRQIGLTRLIISESRKTPELAARFRRQAIDTGRNSIMRRLELLPSPAGSREQRECLASTLYGSIVGDMQLRALAGEDIDAFRDEDRLRRRIAWIVNAVVLREPHSPMP